MDTTAAGPSTSASAAVHQLPMPSQRVTYVLYQPLQPPARLHLPDVAAGIHPSRPAFGKSSPLVVKHQDQEHVGSFRESCNSNEPDHPRHSLGVTSLAIDPSTAVLKGSSSKDRADDEGPRPEGLFYSGGKDGLVVSWELNIKMKKRQRLRKPSRRSSWGFGATADGMDEEDDEWVMSDGAASSKAQDESALEGEEEDHSDTGGHAGLLSSSDLEDWQALPFEKQWEVDSEALAAKEQAGLEKPIQARFRSCVQSHTDWISDMRLCNMNQTVVTASYDRFIRLWNPHDPQTCLAPSVLGSHSDYVKVLALPSASSSSWIASGGLDEKIRLWDLQESRREPLIDIHDSASIYCLSTDSRGAIIAASTPEQGIRLYDPRANPQSGPVGQLLGHSDMPRQLLLSSSGRHLLSSSSDGTVRFWDVGEQRALHTYSHHSSSVTSLFSSSDELEIFYSGDRDGYLCKTDTEGCTDPDEGECVAIAKSEAAIERIVALDNSFIWTCGKGSDIECWRDVPTRTQRQATHPIHVESSYGAHRDSLADYTQARPASRSGWTRFSTDTTRTAGYEASPSQAAVRDSGRSPMASALRQGSQSGLAASPPADQPPQPHAHVSFSIQDADGVDPLTVPESNSRSASQLAPYVPPVAPGVDPAATLFGIPFDSLICLSPEDAAIGLGTGFALGTAAGMGSMLSLRGSTLHLGVPGTGEGGARAPSISLGRNSFAYEGTSGATASVARLAQLRAASSGAQRPTSVRSLSHSIRFVPHAGESAIESGSPAVGFDVDGGERSAKDDAAAAARRAYEERDFIIDATPLRPQPMELIRGVKGLIRSSMLNDRRHVLTFATSASSPGQRGVTANSESKGPSSYNGPEIGLWDILRCKCIGIWFGPEILSLVEQGDTAGDLLEKVKERIEGQGAASSWCSIDTKSGSLSVHLDYPALFDAEVYLDECNWVKRDEYAREDQRANPGKWILRSLFAPFVEQEWTLRSSVNPILKGDELAVEREDLIDQSKSTFQLKMPAHRGGKAGHGDAPRPPPLKTIDSGLPLNTVESPNAIKSQPMRLESFRMTSESSRGVTTPGNTLAIAMAPKTPAFSPRGAGPMTPSLSTGFPAMSSLTEALVSPGAGTGGPAAHSTDYFSLGQGVQQAAETKASASAAAASTARAGAPVTPGPAPGTPSNQPSGSAGGGFMSRFGSKFRSRGERLNTGASQQASPDEAAIAGESGEGAAGPSAADSGTHPSDPPTVALNRAILSKPMTPPPVLEAPLLDLPPNTSILISSASGDAAQWETVYRGLHSSVAQDLHILELASPAWLLDYILCNRVTAPVKSSAKISFLLQPCPVAGEGNNSSGGTVPSSLPSLPSGEAKLTATRWLRVGKAAMYISDKLSESMEAADAAAVRSREGSIVGLSRRPSAESGALQGAGAGAGSAAGSGFPHSGSVLSMTSLAQHSHTSARFAPPTMQPFGPEDIDLLCNGVVLDPYTTLAQVSRFVWRQGGDPRIEYRRKVQ